MIFKETLDALLAGRKGQTRRPAKDGDMVHVVTSAGGAGWVLPSANLHHQGMITAVRSKSVRVKYAVGKDYAIQSDRTVPAVWYRPNGTPVFGMNKEYGIPNIYLEYAKLTDTYMYSVHWSRRIQITLEDNSYREARFEITGIRCEPIQNISMIDMKAEGYVSGGRAWYRELWDSMYADTEFEWARDPLVFPMHIRLIDK